MNKLSSYKNLIKTFYTNSSKTVDQAKATIHPKFDDTKQENVAIKDYCLREYNSRFGKLPSRVGDWGCGIGRLMTAYSELDIRVDGFDVSPNMLGFAKERCPTSNFYEVEPDGEMLMWPSCDYDLIFSFLVLQHNCNRYLRLKNLESIRELTPNGLAIVQMLFQPNCNEVDGFHHKYTENAVAHATNSVADCVITKDTLGDVYEDFSLFWDNVTFNFQPNDSVNKFDKNHIIILASWNTALFIFKQVLTPIL